MVQPFSFSPCAIPGVIEITPFDSSDLRGSFTKDYATELFLEHGIALELKEVFYTTSKVGVIRGVHFQRERQQAKLVRCISGHVYDVVVDLRKESPTFATWQAFDLKGDNTSEIYIPEGCGHAYLVLEDSIVSYKCGERFYGEFDDGIRWDDCDIAIDWPLELIGGADHVIVSEKDRNLQTFADFVRDYGGF